MKIFDAHTIKVLDRLTTERQNITSLDLMERASSKVFEWLKHHFSDSRTVFHIFCGVGNNGGDGLAVARMLRQKGYQVYVYVVSFAPDATPDFKTNLERLKNTGADVLNFYDFPEIKPDEVVIDAIFGIGLSRPLATDVQELIGKINQSGATVISIDIPSGMFLNQKTETAVCAGTILTFQFPKTAFFHPENARFFNNMVILDIGLDAEVVKNSESEAEWIDKEFISNIYKPVPRNSHKGNRGHTVIIGGSYGKIGATVLAAKAALKSGCGLVTAVLPECGYTVMQTAFPEAMVITPGGKDFLNLMQFDLKYNTVAIGMGMGTEPETAKAFHEFLQSSESPLLIDADALNILSQNTEWLELLPEKSILTPHPLELKRLIGEWTDDFDKILKAKAFSKKYGIIMVIKGAFTHIIDSDMVYINSSGNQALATGGSGDTLSGIIAGLTAQGYEPAEAAILGVFLHGKTADIAVRETGYESFTASDIIDYLGKAFLEI